MCIRDRVKIGDAAPFQRIFEARNGMAVIENFKTKEKASFRIKIMRTWRPTVPGEEASKIAFFRGNSEIPFAFWVRGGESAQRGR